MVEHDGKVRKGCVYLNEACWTIDVALVIDQQKNESLCSPISTSINEKKKNKKKKTKNVKGGGARKLQS